jgi:hypothetical protein
MNKRAGAKAKTVLPLLAIALVISSFQALSADPETGAILVASNEKATRILVDGVDAAMSADGLLTGIAEGKHRLELQGDGSVFREEVEVIANEQTNVQATLVPIGFLALSLPEDAKSKLMSASGQGAVLPLDYGILSGGDSLLTVAAGSYTLSVTGDGYRDFSASIAIERGKTLSFRPELLFASAELALANYGAEADRLQGVLGSGVAQEADVEDARFLAKRLAAEARPELAALSARADALVAALPSRLPSAAALHPSAGGYILSLVSDPPGMKVAVDSEREVTTPARIAVAAGSHRIQPKPTLIKGLWYEGDALQWSPETAGKKSEVPIATKPAKARLSFKRLPAGLSVKVNGVLIGSTPIQEAEVQAGSLDLRFEGEGAIAFSQALTVLPSTKLTVVWGTDERHPIVLTKKTVKLEAKPDSWSGVEPIYEASAATSFMGDAAFGAKRVFMCRDDKYLYWRVDFNQKNPLDKLPQGTKKAITVQLSPWFNSLNKSFGMAVQYDRGANATKSYVGSYYGSTQSWKQLGENAISFKVGKDMLVARLDLDWIKKNCQAIGNVSLEMANTSDDWQWEKSTQIGLPLGFVDFTK